VSWEDLPPGAVTAVAILTAGAIGWWVQLGIARRRATIDFIARLEVGSREWRETKRTFARLTDESEDEDPDRLKELVDPVTAQHWDDRIAVASLLGHFEAVAVAINHNTLSERIYKDWNRSSYIGAWEKGKPFVTELREAKEQRSAYKNFQTLAEEWTREREVESSRWLRVLPPWLRRFLLWLRRFPLRLRRFWNRV